MSDAPLNPKSRYLWVYWLGVTVYLSAALGFATAMVNLGDLAWTTRVLFGLLIVGPPFFYGSAFFATSDPGERAFVKLLAEIWGPFWAAASAVFALIFKGAG